MYYARWRGTTYSIGPSTFNPKAKIFACVVKWLELDHGGPNLQSVTCADFCMCCLDSISNKISSSCTTYPLPSLWRSTIRRESLDPMLHMQPCHNAKETKKNCPMENILDFICYIIFNNFESLNWLLSTTKHKWIPLIPKHHMCPQSWPSSVE